MFYLFLDHAVRAGILWCYLKYVIIDMPQFSCILSACIALKNPYRSKLNYEATLSIPLRHCIRLMNKTYTLKLIEIDVTWIEAWYSKLRGVMLCTLWLIIMSDTRDLFSKTLIKITKLWKFYNLIPTYRTPTLICCRILCLTSSRCDKKYTPKSDSAVKVLTYHYDPRMEMCWMVYFLSE